MKPKDTKRAIDQLIGDLIPDAFVGFLGKTEDGKAELAKKEIVKAFDINKTMKEGKR